MRIMMPRLFLISLLLCCARLTSYSQSEKEIAAKYHALVYRFNDETQAVPVALHGNFKLGGLSMQLQMNFKPPKSIWVEMKLQSMNFLMIQNDSLKWEYNSMTGENTVTPAIKYDADSKSTADPFDFVYNDLLKYQERKNKLKLKGKTKLDSLEVFELELTRQNKTVSIIYIRVKDYLIQKIQDEGGFRYFADYRYSQGFPFPRLIIESEPEQSTEIRFDSVFFGADIPDSIFVIPARAFEKKSVQKKVKVNSKKVNDDFLEIGDAFYNKGDYDSAIFYYNESLKEDGDSFRGFNARGLARIGKNEYYDAISDFKRASELDPKSWAPLNNIGLAKYYLGDPAGAIKDYTSAYELDPSEITVIRNRGIAFTQLEQYDKAIADFDACIKIDSNNGEIYFRIGHVKSLQEKFDDALQMYQKAFALNYRTHEVDNLRGVAWFKLENYDSALVYFRNALEVNPDNLQYIKNYGMTFFYLEDYSAATKQFEAYLKRDKKVAEMHNLIGLCKYHEDDFKGSIKDFTRAIEVNEKEAQYYDNRASAKENIEDYQGAIADYGESIRIYPNDPQVFYKRGLIKIRTSKKIEGCLDLTTAHEMKYEPAKEAIMKNCN